MPLHFSMVINKDGQPLLHLNTYKATFEKRKCTSNLASFVDQWKIFCNYLPYHKPRYRLINDNSPSKKNHVY